MNVRIANAPCSWGIYVLDDAKGISFERILDEIAGAGYAGTELGPYGFFPTDPSQLKDALAERGLTLPAGSAKEAYHVASEREHIFPRVRRTAALLRDVGAQFIVILGGGAATRLKTAGRADLGERLSPAEWKTFCKNVTDTAKMVKNEFGLTAVLHPHAGSYVEFEDEVTRAMNDLDPKYVSLCVDTGHCAYAGIDVIKLFSQYAARTPYLHLKNIDPVILARVRADRIELPKAVKKGVFSPLDAGVVDFSELARALKQHGYSGWATVEQDCDISAGGNPLRDACDSFEFLQSVGMNSRPRAVAQ